MNKTLTLIVALYSVVAAQASYLPFFDGIRTAILDRQVAISNAAPFDTAEKKELNALKVALKNVNKTSTSLKTDMTILAAVVKGINKGASNETFSFEFRTTISNYVDVLVATNDTLEEILSDANNNPVLKAKAQTALDNAQATLANVQPETDLGGAPKSLSAALKQFLSATKAVVAAANAQPVPLPAPRAGTLVVEVNGQRLTLGAEFLLRNTTFTALLGAENGNPNSALNIFIPDDGGPGTYSFGFIFNTTVGGQSIGFTAESAVAAEVTKATSSVLVGSIEGTGTLTIDGVSQGTVPFTCRFNGKRFSFIP